MKFTPRISKIFTGLLLAALTVQTIGFIRLGMTQVSPDRTDFLPYWISAQYIKKYKPGSLYSNMADDAVNVYATDESSDLDPNAVYWAKGRNEIIQNQSPFLYSVIATVGSDNFENDFLIFRIISIGCLFAGFVLLCLKLHYTLNWALALLIYLISAFTPIVSDIGNSNTNLMQFGILSVALLAGIAPSSSRYFKIRHFIAGALFAFCLMLKPLTFFVPLFLFIFKAFRREWTTLAYELSGALTCSIYGLVTAYLFIGSLSCWWQWILKNSKLAIYPVVETNFSFPAILLHLTGKNFSSHVLVIGLFLILFRTLKFMYVQRKADASVYIECRLAAAGCLVWIICMPLVWVHYYVLSVPMILCVMSPGGQNSMLSSYRMLSWLAILAVSLKPITLLAESMIQIKLIGLGDNSSIMLFIGCSAWLGAAALFFVGTAGLSTPQQQLQD